MARKTKARQSDHPPLPGFSEDSNADGWRVADPTPCTVCRYPAFMRDPNNQPRHRVDCKELTR